jgi:transcription elongation factor SPT6
MDAKGNALTGATMMITEDSDSDVDMEETDGKQKQSKAVQLKKKATRVQSRLRRFARNMDELKLLLKAVGMTPRQLGENLYDGKYKKHEPVDYTGSPEQAAVKTATYANYQTRRAENPPVVEPTDAAADAQVDLTAEGLAAVAVAGKQEDVQSTLKLFRSIAAQLVAQDPFVRAAVYKEMESDGVVNTKPTAKGIREIDPYHQYYCVKRLMDKPLHRFDQTQYLLCKKAENEGFITVTISFPTSGRRNVIDADGMDTTEDTKNGDGEDPFLREVIELYSSSGYGLDSEAWNEQRNLIVTAALSEYIYPSVTKELSRNLLRTAQEYVCSKAARNLKTMVSVYPYLNAVTGRGQGKIISCCVGDGKQASMFVVLNKYGEVLDRLTVHFFKMKIRGDRGSDMELYQKRKDDIRRIQTLFSTHNPSLLTIASVDMQCISFKKQLEETALFDFREIKVEFVDPAIGRIFMNTDRSKDEFKDYPPLMLQAVGIGRYVLNPLDMVCSFWTTDGRKEDNDILGFKLHDLQAFVPARMLLQALGRTLMSAVCYVGIHINAVVHAGHKNSSLQFVPGLGPKSAKQLIQAIQQMRKAHLATREQLLTHCGLGETVYKNAAAFIRVESLDSGRQKSKTSNILDTTRIHPEHYDLVERFVLGALKIDDLDDQTDEDEDDIIMSDVDSEDGETGDGRRGGDNVDDEAAKKAVEHKKKTQRMLLNVFNDRSQWSILDAFDVEIFAEMEESKGHGKVTRLIKLIKQEVKGRFADVKRRLRTFAAPTESQLYTLLSGETDQTLFAGCLVSAVVVATGRNGVICRLDNGLKGFIDLKMLSDTAPPEQDHFVRDEYDDRGFEDENAAHEAKVQAFIDERVERGMAVTARVMNINKERMSVDLATCSSEVKDTRKQWITKLENDLDDTYLYKESAGMHPEDASFLKQLKAKRNVHRFVQRNVFHPLFRNLSRTESVALLEADNTDYAGECIIRPSTKASNHLTLTIRIHEDILIDVDILEEDKPSKQALGKVLKIQGEVFEDLDEINDRYVMPLIDYGQLLIGHQKFRFGNEDDVTDMLQVEKQQEPNRLPYLISFASDKPGQLYFSYLPNNNTRREKFYIVYNGFHYHSKVYSSVNSLVDAIKRMIKKKMAADRHRGKSGRSERKQPPQRPAYPEQQQQQQQYQQYQQQQQQPPRRPGEYNRGDNVQVYYQQVWYNGNIQNVGRDGQETLYTVAFPNGYTTVPATYLRA